MNTITAYEKFIGVNNVIYKSNFLGQKVKEILGKYTTRKDGHGELEKVLTQRVDEPQIIEKRFRTVKEQIKNIDGIIERAIIKSLKEYRIDICYDECNNSEIKELIQNNELKWEAIFCLDYGIMLATQDIKRFNKSINNLEVPLKNSDVIDLVNAIRLIRQFRDLFEIREKNLSENPMLATNYDLMKQNEVLINLLEEKQKQTQSKSKVKGFNCEIDPDIIKEIFQIMVDHKPKPQIEGKSEDFQAIFSNELAHFDPIEWHIKHGKKPNKTALFTFIKLMLELDEVSRETLRQSNSLFVFGKENIFPDKYTYPSIDEQKSSYITHFKDIKHTYFPTFLKD